MARKSRRKKSSSSNPIPVIVGAICAIALLAVGYIIVTRGGGETNVTPLNAETYANSPNSLRGSTFAVTAEVVKKLHYEEGVRQVLQVTYNNEHIPIEIPADVEGPNINTQQEYTFIVKAKNDAWLVASSYTDK